MVANDTHLPLVKEVKESAIDLADRLFTNDQILEASRVLRGHLKSTGDEDGSSLTPRQVDLMSKASLCENTIEELKAPPGDDWTDLGKVNAPSSSLSSSVHYKIEFKDGKHTLSARADTVIPADLLVPFISVLNESDLYADWFPHWTRPKVGVRSSTKLSQTGRASQVISVVMDTPWPLPDTEAVIGALGVDDIDASRVILINLTGLHTGDEDGLVPPPNEGILRVDFTGGFLIRPYLGGLDRENHEDGTCEAKDDRLLLTFKFTRRTRLEYVPKFLLGFVARTVTSAMWNRFLVVSMDVRDGKRPHHADAIQQKRSVLYDWIDERALRMFQLIEKDRD